MARVITDPACVLAQALLDGAFAGKGWHGPTLNGSLRGVTARTALWRPGAGRRCIWEHVLHAAYWKYALVRVFTPDAVRTFDRSPSNWPHPPPRADEKAWRSDRVYLAMMHKRLRSAVLGLDLSRLGERAPGRKWTFAMYLAGAAAHDAYHTGQVQLLKRLSDHKRESVS
jgi:hypothetical protein